MIRATSLGATTPRSVTIAVTSSAGVTSKAGFHTPTPLGAERWPRQAMISSGERSSIGIAAPLGVAGSMVERRRGHVKGDV